MLIPTFLFHVIRLECSPKSIFFLQLLHASKFKLARCQKFVLTTDNFYSTLILDIRYLDSSIYSFLLLKTPMMPMKAVGRGSLFRQIQMQIRNFIIENQLVPGDMLPPAAEMATRLGVSSATLREAFRSLETLGVLDTKHGVGTFIRAYDISPILDNLSFTLLFKSDNLYRLIQIREAMEVGLISAVVEQIDDENVQELETVLERMVHSQANGDLEIDFHRTLYRCLNNELIPQFLDIFWLVHNDLIDQAMILPADSESLWQTHIPIVEAIKSRDVDAAISAIRHHFDGIKSQLNGIEIQPTQPASSIAV